MAQCALACGDPSLHETLMPNLACIGSLPEVGKKRLHFVCPRTSAQHPVLTLCVAPSPPCDSGVCRM
jgi:hypothetical protein